MSGADPRARSSAERNARIANWLAQRASRDTGLFDRMCRWLLDRAMAVISSMTKQERNNHLILNGSRRKRIAMGSGTSVAEVNRFLKQFQQTKKVMDDNNVEDLPGLIEVARELEVRMVACEMTMGVMGITRDELVDWCDYGGAATYLEHAADSRLTLFI